MDEEIGPGHPGPGASAPSLSAAVWACNRISCGGAAAGRGARRTRPSSAGCLTTWLRPVCAEVSKWCGCGGASAAGGRREPHPSLWPTENAGRVLDRFPNTLRTHGPKVRFVAERLGDKNVAELERLATALYVVLQKPDATPEERAGEIHRLKPHVSLSEGRAALQSMERMRGDAASLQAE